MRKLLLGVLIVFLMSSATATTIQHENVTVDLEDSSVELEVAVGELTSSTFTYITSYRVNEESINTRINGEEIDCDVTQLQVGTEINCPTDLRHNFTVEMGFKGHNFVSESNEVNVFDYSQSIFRPTRNYNMKVILPSGTGLLNQANASAPIVRPSNYEVGSNGRRIFIEWHTEPGLGDTLSFSVMFEEFSSPVNYLKIAAAILLILIIAGVGYMTWKRKTRENIESVYEELSEDQITVIELLRDNGGSMLQKDVVNESEYSKAKISGVVSELVEKEIVEKEKEGRSNKLTIARKYSG